VISEDDAAPFEFTACGQLVVVGGQELIRLLSEITKMML
jgi:hypothetical protein